MFKIPSIHLFENILSSCFGFSVTDIGLSVNLSTASEDDIDRHDPDMGCCLGAVVYSNGF